mgnify:CR=1 FL=1
MERPFGDGTCSAVCADIGWTQSGKSLPLCLSAFGQPLCFDQPDCHTAGEKEPFPRNAEL